MPRSFWDFGYFLKFYKSVWTDMNMIFPEKNWSRLIVNLVFKMYLIWTIVCRKKHSILSSKGISIICIVYWYIRAVWTMDIIMLLLGLIWMIGGFSLMIVLSLKWRKSSRLAKELGGIDLYLKLRGGVLVSNQSQVDRSMRIFQKAIQMLTC